MTASMLLAAARPWTYWFAPVFLVATLALVVALAVAYYRKVMVPAFLWKFEDQARRRSSRPAGDVHRLRPDGGTPIEQMAA